MIRRLDAPSYRCRLCYLTSDPAGDCGRELYRWDADLAAWKRVDIRELQHGDRISWGNGGVQCWVEGAPQRQVDAAGATMCYRVFVAEVAEEDRV